MAYKLPAQKQTVKIKVLCVFILGVLCALSLIFSQELEKGLHIGAYVYTNPEKLKVVKNGDLVVHYIDVGQGDATLIELPDGTKMLIDAGTDDPEKVNELISYLKNDAKVDRINYLVLTHSDSDHCGGMVEVLKTFEVQNIFRPFQLACVGEVDVEGNVTASAPIAEEDLRQYYVPATTFEGLAIKQVVSECFSNFVRMAYKETWTNEDGSVSNATVCISHEGIVIDSIKDNVEFCVEFFAPPVTNQTYLIGATKTKGRPVKKYFENNNASPIILMEYAGQSFLFTGDAEAEVEEEFVMGNIDNDDLLIRFVNVSVYKAGHHGSKSSSTKTLLTLINPTYTVVSCGKDNDYGHPSGAFLERWEDQVATQGKDRKQTTPFVTASDNTIIFSVNSDGTLDYCLGVRELKNLVHWGYFALAIFVVGTIIIIRLNIKVKPKNQQYIQKQDKI